MCAACCAGPTVAALAAIGVGTALGAASFGAGAIIVGGLLTAFVVRRRRRRLISAPCALPEPVAVAAPTPGSHR